jgi:hypothetical protein
MGCLLCLVFGFSLGALSLDPVRGQGLGLATQSLQHIFVNMTGALFAR